MNWKFLNRNIYWNDNKLYYLVVNMKCKKCNKRIWFWQSSYPLIRAKDNYKKVFRIHNKCAILILK